MRVCISPRNRAFTGSCVSVVRIIAAAAPGQPHAANLPPASPCEVWTWDITWLPGPVLGMFFYLYLIVDIYSRKIVGWEVHERESAELAAGLLERAVWAERCLARPVVLHADNGSAMKGATMKATMERLGVIASFSRPRVSNDNPYSKGPVPNL